jgi:hypothetical protein
VTLNNSEIFRIKVFDELNTPIVNSKFDKKKLPSILEELKEKFG